MKSRTSFFNRTVLRKDITRFAPVWALYTVFLLYSIYINGGFRSDGTRNFDAYILSSPSAPMNLVYAFLCATLLFGDLFQSRMCNALHAMPLRRETWFFTHVLSGILFFVVPTTLAALIRIPLLGEYPFLAVLWWLVEVGSFLFHFALAIFCAMCAGNRLGHATVFVVIGFFPVIIYGIYSAIYESMLYGIVTDSALAEDLSPAMVLNTKYFNWTPLENAYQYNGIYPKDWIILAVCVAISIFLYFAALYLYKRRKLEWAGDFINYKVLHWVLLVLGSFYFAILIPVVGFIIGFFVICMLLERTVKVFHKGNWIRFGALAGAALLSIGLTYLDPAGITDYIPEAQQVESIGIGYENSPDYVLFRDTESIHAAMDAHEYALSKKGTDIDFDSDNHYSLQLNYHLNNGRTVIRRYTIPINTEPGKALQKRLSSFEVLFGTPNVDAFIASVYTVQVNLDNEKEFMTPLYQWQQLPLDQYDELFAAIVEDCENGVLAQDYTFHQDDYRNHDTLRFWYYTEDGKADVEIMVFSGSKTYALLTQ